IFACDYDQHTIVRKVLHFAPNNRANDKAHCRDIQFKGFTLNTVVVNELTGSSDRYDKLPKAPVVVPRDYIPQPAGRRLPAAIQNSPLRSRSIRSSRLRGRRAASSGI
ncbi:hypothetical protein, partial [Hoeflea sp.]|uniref:hypothetical protein n=1 Tax=Hoeflea sp. TaxID=1940281 RepID=UPI0025C045DC